MLYDEIWFSFDVHGCWLLSLHDFGRKASHHFWDFPCSVARIETTEKGNGADCTLICGEM
jgi:hypothetical protein